MKTNDERIIEGSDNIFSDLGFDKAQAEIMKLRAEVMIRTANHLQEQGLTQAQIAQQLEITQPRVSRLLKYKVEDFSLDMLLTLATRAGLQPRLQL